MLGWVICKIVDPCIPNNMELQLLLPALEPPELPAKGPASLLEATRCPAGELAAGYSSKPLQGSLFVKHRNVILGVREEDFDLYKEMYVAVLKQHDLYINEEDLFDL